MQSEEERCSTEGGKEIQHSKSTNQPKVQNRLTADWPRPTKAATWTHHPICRHVRRRTRIARPCHAIRPGPIGCPSHLFSFVSSTPHRSSSFLIHPLVRDVAPLIYISSTIYSSKTTSAEWRQHFKLAPCAPLRCVPLMWSCSTLSRFRLVTQPCVRVQLCAL